MGTGCLGGWYPGLFPAGSGSRQGGTSVGQSFWGGPRTPNPWRCTHGQETGKDGHGPDNGHNSMQGRLYKKLASEVRRPHLWSPGGLLCSQEHRRKAERESWLQSHLPAPISLEVAHNQHTPLLPSSHSYSQPGAQNKRVGFLVDCPPLWAAQSIHRWHSPQPLSGLDSWASCWRKHHHTAPAPFRGWPTEIPKGGRLPLFRVH